MEFLRFGSSIPGSYWGCCAADIIQNFKVAPDAKASIQLVSGDGGGPLMHKDDTTERAFVGMTYREIFEERLRIGTFSSRDMPNHAFFAILTESQVSHSPGKDWLKILKENGFEFIRTVDNSVYTGEAVPPPEGFQGSPHKNHVFALFRNIGNGAVKDAFTPPKGWTDLPDVVPEAWQELPEKRRKELTKGQKAAQHGLWTAHGPTKIVKESEVVAAGAPVILAGLRSENPQEPKVLRDNRIVVKKATEKMPAKKAAVPSCFAKPVAPAPVAA